MKKFEIEVRVYASRRYHGSHGVKPQKQKATAANKLRSIVQQGLDPTKSKAKTESVPQSKNITVKVLKKFVCDQTNLKELNLALDKSSAIASAFESIRSDDVITRKNDYSKSKSVILQKYMSTYGNTLSEQVTDKVMNDLKQHAFRYVEFQLVFFITCDEEFEGCHLVDGKYVRTLRSKRVYRMGESDLSDQEYEFIKSSESNGIKVKATLNRRAKLAMDPDTKRIKLMIDFGDVGDQHWEGDKYR